MPEPTNGYPEPHCRSDYYADTGRTQHPGDRVIRCGLPSGHPDEHEEVDEATGESLHDWPARKQEPRAWSLPAEPGPEVTAVRDRHEVIWKRHGSWWRNEFRPYGSWAWGRLLTERGPLTDASGDMP